MAEEEDELEYSMFEDEEYDKLRDTSPSKPTNIEPVREDMTELMITSEPVARRRPLDDEDDLPIVKPVVQDAIGREDISELIITSEPAAKRRPLDDDDEPPAAKPVVEAPISARSLSMDRVMEHPPEVAAIIAEQEAPLAAQVPTTTSNDEVYEEDYTFTDDEYDRLKSGTNSPQKVLQPDVVVEEESVTQKPSSKPASKAVSRASTKPSSPVPSANISPKRTPNSSYATLPVSQSAVVIDDNNYINNIQNTPPTSSHPLNQRSVGSAEKEPHGTLNLYNVQSEGSQVSTKSVSSKRSKKSNNNMEMLPSPQSNNTNNNNNNNTFLTSSQTSKENNYAAPSSNKIIHVNEEEYEEIDDAEPDLNIPLSLRSELIRLSAALGIDHQLSLSVKATELKGFIQSSLQKVEGLKCFAQQAHTSQTSLHQGNDEDFPDDSDHPRLNNPSGTSQTQTSSEKLRERVKQQKDKEQKLLRQTLEFEDGLKKSLQNVNHKGDWQEKYKKLIQKFKKEKEEKHAYEDFIKVQNKKMKVLVEHVDKLMKALKIENSKHLKVIHEYGLLKREQEKTKAQLDKQVRITHAQNRAIQEVTEGSKVLEDQLKLMDEKYLELRAKLDVSRDFFATTVKKYRKESDELRLKYARANQGQLLDHVKLPKTNSSQNMTAQDGDDRMQMEHLQISNQQQRSSAPNSPTNAQNRSNNSSSRDIQAQMQMGEIAAQSRSKVRPKSAYPSTSPSPNQYDQYEAHGFATNNSSSSGKHNRPKSASYGGGTPGSPDHHKYHSPSHNTLHNLPVKEKEKQLSNLVRRIRQKSAKGTKETWSAARLSELLEG